MRKTELDNLILRLAGTQHWLFSRAQACSLGASQRFIARRLAASDWIHPEPSVYGLAGHPMTWARRLKVCELGSPGSAVGGLAAAALLKMDGFRAGPAELVVPPGTSSRGKLAKIHREVGFLTTKVDGIAVTTIAQTAFDIANRVSLWRLERALDTELVQGRLTIEELEERLAFYEGARRAGVARMRDLIAERRADGWVPPESELEALLYAMLARVPSAPEVVRQPGWPWRSAAAGRVDGFLPRPNIIVEGDGRRWHTRVADFDRDRWRDNQAAAHGLRVMRFTFLHLSRFADDCAALVEEAVQYQSRIGAA